MLVAESGIYFLHNLQAALKLLTIVNLVTYLWPEQAVVNDGATYDFIIVGAGTAGSIVANRLTEIENINVLLIEAGGDPPFESEIPVLTLAMKQSDYDWNYTTINDGFENVGHIHPYGQITLGKMLGGSSSLNNMIYNRGQPRDFDSWSEIVGDDTWKWKNVLPYFIKSTRLEDPDILKTPSKEFYGKDGYVGINGVKHERILPVLDAFKEVGHDILFDFNEHQPLGYAPQVMTISDKARQGSARAFLSPIKERKNLHVMKNTLVTKILFNEDKTAIGVEVRTEEGQIWNLKATKEVIVSAGTMNTPKLLMLSGVGSEEHLKSHNIKIISDLPVGENLQDHVSIFIIHDLEYLSKPIPKPSPYELPSPSFTGFVSFNKSNNYPDYQTITYVAQGDVSLLYCSLEFTLKNEICDDMINGTDPRLQTFNQIININPASRGKVLLNSIDPLDKPLIYNGYLTNKQDLEALIDTLQHFTSTIMDSTYYKKVNALTEGYSKCEESDFNSRDYWRCNVLSMLNSMNHFTSTCPMGTVLDSRLKVHGVKGLRVVDASVMPIITRANPYASIMMIGEKAADMIKTDNKLD